MYLDKRNYKITDSLRIRATLMDINIAELNKFTLYDVTTDTVYPLLKVEGETTVGYVWTLYDNRLYFAAGEASDLKGYYIVCYNLETMTRTKSFYRLTCGRNHEKCRKQITQKLNELIGTDAQVQVLWDTAKEDVDYVDDDDYLTQRQYMYQFDAQSECDYTEEFDESDSESDSE